MPLKPNKGNIRLNARVRLARMTLKSNAKKASNKTKRVVTVTKRKIITSARLKPLKLGWITNINVLPEDARAYMDHFDTTILSAQSKARRLPLSKIVERQNRLKTINQAVKERDKLINILGSISFWERALTSERSSEKTREAALEYVNQYILQANDKFVEMHNLMEKIKTFK